MSQANGMRGGPDAQAPAPPQGVGLVLSGGGAKGAYQVGVVQALQEMGVQVDAVAGASIGTLNGAVFAAAPDQAEALKRLQNIWGELAMESPLRPDWAKVPAYLSMLVGFGLTVAPGVGGVAGIARRLAMASAAVAARAGPLEALRRHLQALAPAWLSPKNADGLLSDHPLKSLIDQYVPATGLPERVPLFASAYPTQGVSSDLMRIALASFSLSDTLPSHCMKVQDLPAATQKELLMASAALPLLFSPREVNGTLYSDGGQGGWREQDGNTPIQPLLEAGYRQIVVTHLSDGVTWDRHRFPDATIIEIRPRGTPIERQGFGRDLIGFDNKLIPGWIEQGYKDAMATLGDIKETLDTHRALEASEARLQASLRQTGQAALRDAMKRL